MTTAVRTNDALNQPNAIDEIEYWLKNNCDYPHAEGVRKAIGMFREFSHDRAEIASLKRQIEEARTDEREQCAKIAEICADASTQSGGCSASSMDGKCGQKISAAIRARKDDAP